MDDLITAESGGLIGLLHNQGGGLEMPKPFAREIFLFDTNIAGTYYIEGMDELEKHLNEGDKLDFFREPDNEYDDKAIVIKTLDGVKIGYVPRRDNVIFSRLMDAGKLLFGRISSKDSSGHSVKINIKVYLQD